MVRETKYQCRTARKTGIVLGAAFLSVGFILIAINFGAISERFRHVLISWPMLLIAFGIIHLIIRTRGSSHLRMNFNLLLIFIGCFFIIPRLEHAYPETFSWIPNNFTALCWPVLLIIIGVVIIFKWIFCPKHKDCRHHSFNHAHHRYWDRADEVTSDNPRLGFYRTHIFGGGEYIILDPVFYGGSIEVIFGGIVLDLRKTTLPNEDVVLKIDAIFGGISIHVPEGWNIEPKIDSMAGGFSDERHNKTIVNKDQKLIIDGDCIFGGCEIKN
ncbi:MAG: cell wall-active antibiotics response protein [Bacteroidales bacterium]|jgi:predicted membrane protein|nr:cell wall-active antibiotics response protein [Bacteroidales bacterium]